MFTRVVKQIILRNEKKERWALEVERERASDMRETESGTSRSTQRYRELGLGGRFEHFITSLSHIYLSPLYNIEMTDIFDQKILDSLEWSKARATYRNDMSPTTISQQGEYKHEKGRITLVPRCDFLIFILCLSGQCSDHSSLAERSENWVRPML
eukprot:sb/3473228/